MLEEKKSKLEGLEFQMFVLDELAESIENKGGDVIRLTLGKSPEPLNSKIIKKYHEAIDDISKRNIVYPQGLPELREEIANWYTSLGNKIDKSSVIINTGTSPFFKDLMKLLIDSTDQEILMPHPYYSVYYVSAVLAGAKVKFYEIDQNSLKINMESFKNNYSQSKTKLVILCSPGNPYGNILSKSDFNKILNVVGKDTFILSDEIYRNVSFRNDSPSILDVTEDDSRVIVTNSFSKGFRMYTSRVGFVILPKKLNKYFRVLQQHTLLTTNPVEQYAALEAIKQRSDVDIIKKIYSERNNYIDRRLRNIKGIKNIKALGGFYCVINCSEYMNDNGISSSAVLARDILEKTGVAVVPGTDFGINDCLRISFTSTRFVEAVNRLRDYFLGQ